MKRAALILAPLAIVAGCTAMAFNGWQSLYNDAHQAWAASKRESDEYRSSNWVEIADRDLSAAMYEAERIPREDPRRAIAIAKTYDARATMFKRNPHPDEARGRAVGILDETIARGPYDGAIDSELTALRGEIFAKISTATPTIVAEPTPVPDRASGESTPRVDKRSYRSVVGEKPDDVALACDDPIVLRMAIEYRRVGDYAHYNDLLGYTRKARRCKTVQSGSVVFATNIGRAGFRQVRMRDTLGLIVQLWMREADLAHCADDGNPDECRPEAEGIRAERPEG